MTHQQAAERRQQGDLRRRCWFVLPALLAALIGAAGAGGPASPSPEDQYRQFLDKGQYDLAVKIAILHFRPDLHCKVLIAEAREATGAAEKIIDDQEIAEKSDIELLNQAAELLAQAHSFRQQALSTAQDYVDAGWDPTLQNQVREQLDSELGVLEELSDRLEVVRRRAKPLDILMTQTAFSTDDIERLSTEAKLKFGFYLADRGLFERAIIDCFEPVQVEGSVPMKSVAKVAGELLSEWHIPASHNRKWDNLVNKGLDAFDEWREQMPDQIQCAGWFLALTAHLARDHYDVPASTIKDTLTLLEELKLPTPTENNERLLAAKLEHERFLISRRAGRWHVALPSANNLDLFSQANDIWYTAEAALIAAAAAADQSTAQQLLRQSQEAIAALRTPNERLALALQKKVDRYLATTKPFDDWLAVAMSRDYQDRRGTVLPEVMVETRPQLANRVRTGFEESITQLLAAGQNDEAFQQAQKAKALTVGRIANPVSVSDLLTSKLLSQGTGGEMQIPRKELFIEYYFGPTKAWAFYVFAAGDVYEPLQVVELNRKEVIARCTEAINGLQQEQQIASPGTWLLSGSPTLDQLWDRLEDWKKSNPHLRRVVIAPDGPLCYLPLHTPSLSVAASISYLPTAAVLGSSEILDTRDVKLMWEAQRGDLAPAPPSIRRQRGQTFIKLWPQMAMPILLKDAAI